MSEKSWNWPGAIFPPDQMTSETAWVNFPSSVTIGLANVIVLTEMVHPGTGWTSRSAIGWPVGIFISSLVVSALASSLGTWKVSTAADPACAELGVTVIWASAGTASSRTVAAAAGTVTAVRNRPLLLASRRIRVTASIHDPFRHEHLNGSGSKAIVAIVMLALYPR